jgi:diguanylate cyclase (GGDEF)-like protein
MDTAPADTRPPDADGRLLRRLDAIRWVIAGALVGLLVVGMADLLDGSLTVVDALLVAGVGVLGVALLVHHRTTAAITARRHVRDESMTRILQGLSRSLSPDSVVDAIVAELRAATDADHVVVARVRQPDQVVEVTLVAASPTVPASRTWLRPEVADLAPEVPRSRLARGEPAGSSGTTAISGGADRAGAVGSGRLPAVVGEPVTMPGIGDRTGRAARAASQAAADEIARRVRSAYGLGHTLAEPLVADRRFLGALVLSRRTRVPWGEGDRRLLAWAAAEVAAAFTRAYALEEAERGAHIDALTGLPNRRYFNEQVSILRPRRRSTDQLGILMVDIDRFKGINDRFGHATGDLVLRAVADAIANTIRAEDTPARYGGEEFAVILRRASAPQASEVAERVRTAVASVRPEELGVDAPITVSVGVAMARDEEDVSAVIERADRALYLAKRRGRDRVESA